MYVVVPHALAYSKPNGRTDPRTEFRPNRQPDRIPDHCNELHHEDDRISYGFGDS